MGIEFETEVGTLGVGTLPERKRPCLYLTPPGGEGRVLAIFHGDDEAAAFTGLMRYLAERMNEATRALCEAAGMEEPDAEKQGDPVGRPDGGG